MSNDPIRIEEQVLVGRNAHGYTFAAGRVGDRWFGYAIGGKGLYWKDDGWHGLGFKSSASFLFFLSGISEGHQLGLTDRDEVIRRVGACACDPVQGYGGIDYWCVPEDLRGDPERYRCDHCGEVCCDSDHAGEDDAWDPDGEDWRLP